MSEGALGHKGGRHRQAVAARLSPANAAWSFDLLCFLICLFLFVCFGSVKVQMLAPRGGSGHSCGSTSTSHVMSQCPQNLFLNTGTVLLVFSFLLFEFCCRLRKKSSCMDAQRGELSCFEH